MSDPTFLNQINLLSHQTVQACFHCHKCTAGCPVATEMEYGPDRVLRMVQLGEKERLFASQDIWLCASCETCGTRCPNQIDIAQVMDALRGMAVAEGATVAGAEAVKFHKLFLFFVQNMGRMHEASLLAVYKLWTRNLIADMDSGARMFVKGKIPIAPHLLKTRSEVKQIFERTK
jgi:heterodisulfide reductase subunit C